MAARYMSNYIVQLITELFENWRNFELRYAKGSGLFQKIALLRKQYQTNELILSQVQILCVTSDR
jgi:hypothetical protein